VILQCPSSVRPTVRPFVRQQFLKATSPLRPLIGYWPNFTGMLPGWSPIKVVQTVPVDCISKVTGSINRFSNCNLQKSSCPKLKAQSFHIWYIASSRGPLPKLFKLCSWSQNWPCLGGHNFTLNYIRKSSNRFFSWTTNRNLAKLHRNDPLVVPYQMCSNGSDWMQT